MDLERSRSLELERSRSLEQQRCQEQEQRLLEAKLRQQQLQSEEENKWLHQEENNLVIWRIYFYWRFSYFSLFIGVFSFLISGSLVKMSFHFL